jgi:hypothetical protein
MRSPEHAADTVPGARSCTCTHTSRWLGRLLVLGLGAIGTEVCASAAASNSTGSSAAAESFKSFVASPPTISRIVFAEHYSQQHGVYPTRYFEGKWQTNAFLAIEWGTSLPEADNQVAFERACGKFEDYIPYWTANGVKRQLTVYILNRGREPGAEHQRTSWPRPSGLVHLGRALNMGIEHAWIASIIWQGDRFSCVTEEAGLRVSTDGELEVAEGRAAGLRLAFKVQQPGFKEPLQFKWQILYDYEPSSTVPFLPSRIRTLFVEKDGSTSPMTEIEILSLATSASPLAAEAFSTNQAFLRGIAQTFYASNGSTFYPDATGGVRLVASASDPKLLRNIKARQEHVKRFYFLFALLLALPPLWAVLKWHKRRVRGTGTRTNGTE